MIFKNSKLKKILKETDYIFHLAALADIVPSIEKPEKYFNSSRTTFKILNNLNLDKIKNLFI